MEKIKIKRTQRTHNQNEYGNKKIYGILLNFSRHKWNKTKQNNDEAYNEIFKMQFEKTKTKYQM